MCSEVTKLSLAAMLFGEDVVDLESQAVDGLGELAVLAESLCPLAHSPFEICWYGHGVMSPARPVSRLAVRATA